MTIYHATDSSSRQPRMEIFQATWAMRDLPGSSEPFDLQKAVDWVSAQGYAGMMHWAEGEADFEAADVIRRAGLVVGVGFPARPEQIRVVGGDTEQVPHGHVTDGWVFALKEPVESG